MAIIVDKVQKKRDIALACTDLLLEKGIKKLTVAEVAKTAGVAKGSIYDYFTNKEDIVFEIIRSHIEVYQKDFHSKLDADTSSRQKVFLIFDFLLNDNEEFKKHQNTYKEYMGIHLGSENENMCSFNKECSDFFKNVLTLIIEEGIVKGELKKESIDLIEGLLAVEKGFLLISWSEQRDVQAPLRKFLNTLFDLIELK
ncbi:MAG: TetR/AcrR family transcriptional regulator [Campylobacterota bacterium]|nr:TetR/AcrR family transcriptional regulator [Campylobacterota bacterium]